MDVSDILRDRMQEPAGLQTMALLSALGHAALFTAVVLIPGQWFARSTPPPRTVMTISLGGGTPGPVNGGMTSMGGRPVQEATPPEGPKRPEALRQPAAKAPEMTVPRRGAPPEKNASSTVTQSPDQARGRTPTKGAEPTPGSALVDTGVRGQGFGLSTSGGTGAGSSLEVDFGNFCCPDYLTQMINQIRTNWRDQSPVHDEVIVKFTIQRDGKLSDPVVEKPSPFVQNNQAAERALALTRQLLPLPAEYTNPTLGMHLHFKY